MRRQNEWAAEVLHEFPEIDVCDLWQVVVKGKATVYSDWWFDKRVEFEYPQSVPLARTLARHILQAVGKSPELIHSMEVHSAEVPEISDE